MKTQAKEAKWKAKYKGKWYLVKDVEDQGDLGKQNIYHLDEIGPVDQEDIEDLDMAAASLITALHAAGVKINRGRVSMADLKAAVKIALGTKMQVSLEEAIAEILDNIDKTVPARIWEVNENGEDTGKEWAAKFSVKLIEE